MQTVFLRRSRRIYQKVFQRTRSGMERSRSLGRTGSNSRQPFGTLHSGSGFASANTEYAVSLGCTSLHPYLPAVALWAYYTAVKHRIFWNVKLNLSRDQRRKKAKTKKRKV